MWLRRRISFVKGVDYWDKVGYLNGAGYTESWWKVSRWLLSKISQSLWLWRLQWRDRINSGSAIAVNRRQAALGQNSLHSPNTFHLQSPGAGWSKHEMSAEGVIKKAAVWADQCTAVRWGLFVSFFHSYSCLILKLKRLCQEITPGKHWTLFFSSSLNGRMPAWSIGEEWAEVWKALWGPCSWLSSPWRKQIAMRVPQENLSNP